MQDFIAYRMSGAITSLSFPSIIPFECLKELYQEVACSIVKKQRVPSQYQAAKILELARLIQQLLHESIATSELERSAIVSLEQIGIRLIDANIAMHRAYIQQAYMGIMAFSPFAPVQYLATSGASYCLALTFHSKNGCQVGLLSHLDSRHEQYAEAYLQAFCDRFTEEICHTWPNTVHSNDPESSSVEPAMLVATLVCSKDNQRGRQEVALTSTWRQALQQYNGECELRVLYSYIPNIDVLLNLQNGAVQIYQENESSAIVAHTRDALNHPSWLRLYEVGQIENLESQEPDDNSLRYLEQLTATCPGQVAEVSLPKNAKHADFRNFINGLHKATFTDYYETILTKVNQVSEIESFDYRLQITEAIIQWLYSYIASSSDFQDTIRQFCISANQLAKQIERFTCSLFNEERLYQAIQDLVLPANIRNSELSAATDKLRHNLCCLLQVIIKTHYIYKPKKLNSLLNDLLHGSRIIFIPAKLQQTIDGVLSFIQEKLAERLAIIHIIQLVQGDWCMLYIKPEASGKCSLQYYGPSLPGDELNTFINHLGITPEQVYQTIHEDKPYYMSVWLTESVKHLACGEVPPAVVNYQKLLIQQQIRKRLVNPT